MSVRSLFTACRDAYQATAQLDAVTRGERLGMTAAPVLTAGQNVYWRHRGEWLLDNGGEPDRSQDGHPHWSDALQAAYNLPDRDRTADVTIRHRSFTGGGVNPFDASNPEPVQNRLERLEQEIRDGLTQDGQRHELGAEGSPTGRTGWQMHNGMVTRVTRLDEADVPGVQAQIAQWNRFRHPLRPTVQDAKAEVRDVKKAVTRRRWVEVFRTERRP